MKAVLFYFSQTGNTRTIAKSLACVLEEKGYDLRMLPMNRSIPEDVTKCDLLGIGTPCHSSRVPTPVQKFFFGLPVLKGQKAFVFATAGGAPGRVLGDLARLLEGKGATVLGGIIARGEVFHPAPSLQGRFPGRPGERDLRLVEEFAQEIAMGELSERWKIPRPGFAFYEIVGRLATDRLVRMVMPRPSLDLSLCRLCGHCALSCPVGNIEFRPLPALGKKCIRCYNCYISCPQQAWHVDWRLADPIIRILYNPTFERLFGDLNPGENLY